MRSGSPVCPLFPVENVFAEASERVTARARRRTRSRPSVRPLGCTRTVPRSPVRFTPARQRVRDV
jgi:hypothetical protein